MEICLIERSDLRPYDTASAAKVICDVCATKVGAGNIYGIAQHAVFQCRRIVVDESLTAAFFRDLLDNCCRVEIKPAALSTVISLQLRELIGIKAYADGYCVSMEYRT